MSDVVPWILGHGPWCAARSSQAPGGAEVYDVLDNRNLPFFQLVNAGNALAYGGDAMPAWVQLDCACLPSGMMGFGVPRDALEVELWTRLSSEVRRLFGDGAARAAEAWRGLVPLSEYACVPTPMPDEVVGFSLYSLRRGLGVRTKALALLACNVARQTGIAQVHNTSLRTHTALGPLEVISPRVAAHSHAESTFVYRLHVSDRQMLRAVAEGQMRPPQRTGREQLAIDANTTRALEALIAQRGPHAIVDARDGALHLVPWPC